jgi:anti-sigma factor RsiW
MNRHLSIDELIDRLYGLDGSDDHVETCSECAERFRVLQRQRAEAAAIPEPPAAALAMQRRRILARLEEPPQMWLKWTPAAAAACLILAAALVYRPGSSPTTVTKAAIQQEAADEQWFTEIYSLETAEEPQAASPIRALFEESTSKE